MLVVTTLLLNFIVLLFVGAMLDGPMKDPTAMGWPQSVALQEGGHACALRDAVVLGTGDTLRVRLHWRCPGKIRAPQVRVGLLLDVERDPLHHASFIHADGRHEEVLFTRDAPQLVVDPEDSAYYGSWVAGDRHVTTDRPSRIEGIGRPQVEPSFEPAYMYTWSG